MVEIPDLPDDEPSPGADDDEPSACTIVPEQRGSKTIELNVGVDIQYDINDDSKDDSIKFELEVFTKNNEWKSMMTNSSDTPIEILHFLLVNCPL